MTKEEKVLSDLRDKQLANSITNFRVIENTLRAFEKHACQTAGDTMKKYDDRHKKGEYSFIPLPMDYFFQQMTVVQKLLLLTERSNYHFVDVGCGIGTKLVAVHEMCGWNSPFSHITGIEINRLYVEKAREVLKATKANLGYHYSNGDSRTVLRVHCMNALKCNYSAFDVIYFYCPLSRPSLQAKLEERILSTAKKGAYILANMSQGGRDMWAKLTEPVGEERCVYQKI